MLRSPEYMRALMTSPYGVRSVVEADQYIEARMLRQERFIFPFTSTRRVDRHCL
ncbi:hypothetical protein [Nocardia sp. NPDC052566]|uniref:hypothetical protein n=1 Tax=Nocardia sp. NPDC052566 TaxID=3364330 RepID=UPI0037C6BD18